MSDLSHRFYGWKLAKLGETIPYAVALIGSREPGEGEIAHGRSLEAEAEACLSG